MRIKKRILFAALFMLATLLCAGVAAACSQQYGGGHTPPDFKKNEVIYIERNRLSFAKGMEIDELDVIERCGIIFHDGNGGEVKVTRRLLQNGTVRYDSFDLNELGSNKQIKISYRSATNYIFYDVNEYKINFYADEAKTEVWTSANANASLTAQLRLSVWVNLAQYNYSTSAAARTYDPSHAERFNGWYDSAGNSVTGTVALSAPASGNARVLNLYARYLSEEEFASYELSYDASGDRVFAGYTGEPCDMLAVPEGVTRIDMPAVFKKGCNFLKLHVPSTARMDAPFLTAVNTAGLTEISADKGNPHYASFNGALYSKDFRTLYLLPASWAQSEFHSDLAEMGSYSCAYLRKESLALPSSVTTLQYYCFAYSALKRVEGLGNVKNIMSGVFYRSAMETVDDGTALYIRLADGEYSLSMVYDKNVTEYSVIGGTKSIAGSAFVGCEQLRAVTLNDGLEVIGKSAFSGCKSLKSVALPASLKSLGTGVFYGCSGLESVEGLGDVAYINEEGTEYAHTLAAELFYNCSSLQNVSLARGTVQIAPYAFYGCGSLTRLALPETLGMIGSYAFYACGFLEIELPAALHTLGTGAFSHSELTRIELEGCERLTALPSSCFEYTKLTEFTLPERISAVPDYCFYYIRTLKSVTLSNAKEIGERAFSYCIALDQIDWGGSLERIAVRAFTNCYKLDNLVLPDTVISVENYAFQRCDGLTRLTLGKSLLKFGDVPFESDGKTFGSVQPVLYQCYALTEIAVNGENPNFSAIDGVLYGRYADGIDFGENGVLYAVPPAYYKTDLVLPASVRIVIPYAVNFQQSLETITLNEGLENIGKAAFYTAARVIVSNESGSSVYKYLTFHIRSVRLPSTVSHIGASIFLGADVQEFSIAEDNPVYYTDGNLVYSGRTLIMSMGIEDEAVIRDGIEIIASAAFMNQSLQRVEIPDSVREIGHNAFNGCSSLTTVIIGKGLETLAPTAFSALKNLQTVQVSAENPYFHSDGGMLYSKNKRKLLLCAAKNGLTDLSGLPEEIEEIGDWAFAYHATLQSAVIPEGVKRLGDYSFYECRALETLYGSQSLESIGDRAFTFATAVSTAVGETRYCNTLRTVLLYGNLKRIGDYCFYGQYGIESVYFHMSYAAQDELIKASGTNIRYLTYGCPVGATGNFYNDIARYLYSENEPSIDYDGFGWFYMENGAPAKWSKEAAGKIIKTQGISGGDRQ
ncbi:MAG: leucine-rich repeat domain-containing protein [Clostridia bacterium]|nr:leucine-rich repeat domain-containing protein [Clostridia bacterium]